ncbi:hypothetical protein IMZ48_07665 [Candidatus Bathyarchaeota archaeon]|nr:hypothetical protein [Candidatus Bathyarchaeota archaeon]
MGRQLLLEAIESNASSGTGIAINDTDVRRHLTPGRRAPVCTRLSGGSPALAMFELRPIFPDPDAPVLILRRGGSAGRCMQVAGTDEACDAVLQGLTGS